MDGGEVVGLIAVVCLFIGLPWVILHYVTKWKTAPALTNDDEAMLEELYQLARRLEERMETVERLVSDSDSEFRGTQRLHDGDDSVTSIDFNQTPTNPIRERTRR